MIDDKEHENDDLDLELEEEELADLEEIDDELGGEDGLGIEDPENLDHANSMDHELEEEHEDDDIEEYGVKVKKRIGKEVKKTKIQEGKTRQAERERDIIRNDLQKEQKEKVELQIKYNEEKKKRLTEDIDRNKKAASAAMEDGQTEEYMELNDQIVSDKVELSKAEDFHVDVPPEPEPLPEDNMASEAKGWLSRNRSWINMNPAKFAKAKRLSKVLRGEGYDVDSPEMYEEMDRRLENKPKRRSQPLNDPSKNEGHQKPPKKGLTREDKQNMKRFGLNPDSASDRKNWINGKGATV